jgi:very-short-patch-repair endonuclease
MRTVLEQHGLPIGTALENRVTWRLHTWGVLDQCQYRVGKYRLDYAWPKAKIALEVDGPHHWRPDVAVKDVARDAYLRSQGRLVFRADDSSDTLEEQLCRVVVVIGDSRQRGRAA